MLHSWLDIETVVIVKATSTIPLQVRRLRMGSNAAILHNHSSTVLAKPEVAISLVPDLVSFPFLWCVSLRDSTRAVLWSVA